MYLEPESEGRPFSYSLAEFIKINKNKFYQQLYARNDPENMRLTTVNMKVIVFWDVAPCNR
jgi:hypothetical protein